MKIGIYDPYLDTLGGGEKYMLSIASILSQEHDVYLFWDDSEAIKKGSERFHLDLSKVHTTSNIFSQKTLLINRFTKTRVYDRIIYMSDGSIPFLFGKKNFLLFQFPTPWVNGKSLLNRIKLQTIAGIICYSDFVSNLLKKIFTKDITVLAPPIDIPQEIPRKKENVILTVGRFTKGMNTKKQLEMIDAFKKLCDEGLKNWTLILAGGALSTDTDFVSDLKKHAKEYPIELYENVSYEKLRSLYAKAKIYWHAAGFGEDLTTHPERAEHFGITTLEAMSYGAVPIVFHGGGQIEIVTKEAGCTWVSIEELLEKTRQLIEKKTLWVEMSEKAAVRAKEFSMEIFTEKVRKLFL